MDRNAAAAVQFLDTPVRTPGQQTVGRLALKTVDLAQAETHGAVLERAIPIAAIHIHLEHIHSMLACVADDLRGCVEAHRLRVQKRAGEGRGIFPPQPARDVNEVREARSMALRKAVLTKALDLVEAALGKITIVAARDHPADHLVLERADIPPGPE